MKKLRQDLDFEKTYGSVPESFEACVQATLRKTALEASQAGTTAVQRRPFLRMAIVVAALLALTATAVAAMYSRTKDWYLGPNGLGGPDSQVAVDMENGTVSFAGQSTQLGDVIFTLDDVVWGESDLYATGTYRLAEGVEGKLLVRDGDWGSRLYAPFGTDPADATMTYAEYAEANSLQLMDATISMDGYFDADGEMHTSDRAFYSSEESPGVHRFGLMLLLTPERVQAARDGGARFRFTLTVYEYDESNHIADVENGDEWNVVSSIHDTWILTLPEE